MGGRWARAVHLPAHQTQGHHAATLDPLVQSLCVPKDDDSALPGQPKTTLCGLGAPSCATGVDGPSASMSDAKSKLCMGCNGAGAVEGFHSRASPSTATEP